MKPIRKILIIKITDMRESVLDSDLPSDTKIRIIDDLDDLHEKIAYQDS